MVSSTALKKQHYSPLPQRSKKSPSNSAKAIPHNQPKKRLLSSQQVQKHSTQGSSFSSKAHVFEPKTTNSQSKELASIPLRFYVYGHPNITAAHKTTLEFTKESTLTLQGDCIVGVRATGDFTLFSGIKGKMLCTFGNEAIVGYANPSFSHEHELVIRKSDFLSSRTFLIKANKAAFDLPLELKAKLRHSSTKLPVRFLPIHLKAVFFDFDGTLEDWQITNEPTRSWIYDTLAAMANISISEAMHYWEKAKQVYLAKQTMEKYDRRCWFRKFFTITNTPVSEDEIQRLADAYWKLRADHAVLYPYAREVLLALKKKYKVCLLSDSDGSKKYKYDRLKQFNLLDLFDAIILGDDVGVNKPHEHFFLAACKAIKVKPYECMMVGDDPYRDLSTAKLLGMTTLWIKHGNTQLAYPNTPWYVDYSLLHLAEVESIAKELEQ
ncbi:MAG: HAD-IA family hydrolase [Candidatus Woesearchaeota archaeon]